jgi:hypothetical protein
LVSKISTLEGEREREREKERERVISRNIPTETASVSGLVEGRKAEDYVPKYFDDDLRESQCNWPGASLFMADL